MIWFKFHFTFGSEMEIGGGRCRRIITVFNGDGSCAVYQKVNWQPLTKGGTCAKTSAPPRSVNVVEIPWSLDVKDKSQRMASSSNPHNINGEASTQPKTSKNKANHGKRKPSRKEKARRAAQQSKAKAANAQKLKDDEALAVKQVKDHAPVEPVEKEALAKTYANVVQSSSSPAPSAVTKAVSPSTSSSGTIVKKAAVSGHSITKSAKSIPLDPHAAPWKYSSTSMLKCSPASPHPERPKVYKVTNTIAPDHFDTERWARENSWYPASASSRIAWERQITQFLDTKVRGAPNGNAFYEDGIWYVRNVLEFVGVGVDDTRFWYYRDAGGRIVTTSPFLPNSYHRRLLMEVTEKYVR